MKRLSLKVPPVFVWALFALLGGAINHWSLIFVVTFSNSLLFSVVLLLLSVIIGVLGVIEFKKHQTSVNPVELDKAKNIVSSGVFSYSRNPMYLALAIALTATSIFQSSFIFVITVPMFVLYMNQFQIKAEEDFLKDKFGGEYQRYLTQVRRWL